MKEAHGATRAIPEVRDEEVRAVLAQVRLIPEDYFRAHPGGWGERISLALIDAVYSIAAQYRTRNGRGIHDRLTRLNGVWESTPESPLCSLHALAEHDESDIRQIMGNGKVAPSSAYCRYKSIAVVDAAAAFSTHGIDTADDLRQLIARGEAGFEQAKRIYTGIPGLGAVTYEYWLMLLGIPGIKADRRVINFVTAALDVVPAKKVDARFARRVVEEAYTLWRTEHAQARGDVSLIDFDHAIWLYDREQDNARNK